MVLQSIVIFFLSFWIYQEYLNNQYLQTYVDTSLQGTGLEVVALASVTGFTAVALILHKKLQRAQKERGEVLSNETVRKPVAPSPGLLDHKTEQHLIEMIRRAGPDQPMVQGGPMPVLKRAHEEDSSEQPKP